MRLRGRLSRHIHNDNTSCLPIQNNNFSYFISGVHQRKDKRKHLPVTQWLTLLRALLDQAWYFRTMRRCPMLHISQREWKGAGSSFTSPTYNLTVLSFTTYNITDFFSHKVWQWIWNWIKWPLSSPNWAPSCCWWRNCILWSLYTCSAHTKEEASHHEKVYTKEGSCWSGQPIQPSF
jgi:hypothetical protein